MNVLLPTRSNVDLGSRDHGGSKFQGTNLTMWFLPQGNLYFSGIGPICPIGSVELNKYSLGKLLCTVGSYFIGVYFFIFYFNYFLQEEHCNRHVVPFLELLQASKECYQSILNHMSGTKFWLYV